MCIPGHALVAMYSKTNYADVEPTLDAMYFLQDALDIEHFGITVVECEPGWSGREHDHSDQTHEEVYLLVEGEATVTVDGEAIKMESGDAIRIGSEATRNIESVETESTFVLVGAPSL